MLYKAVLMEKWNKNPYHRKINISKETIESFIQFSEIFAECENDIKKVKRLMPEDLKKTLWYYLKVTSNELMQIRTKKYKRNVY